MYVIKWSLFFMLMMSFSLKAQDCSKIFDVEEVPELETLELCRDFTVRQSRRFERPVFQTQLEQDLIERLIYVVSGKEDCFYARESFFSSYGIRNRENPTKDMNEELERFWGVLKMACPKI